MTELQYLSPQTAKHKQVTKWYCEGLKSETQLVRWGNFGVPLLLFPTAGGDAEEVERFFLVKALDPFIHAGRIKVYSVDSIAGKTWLTEDNVAHCVWTQKQFDLYLRNEVVPAIEKDCNTPGIDVITAGASIGAFNALLAICRHPDVFQAAICMSGTYDIDKWLKGQWFQEFAQFAPLHFVPDLPENDQLEKLRQRLVLIPTGQGKYEDPEESWKVAKVLGDQQIPNRVDVWDDTWDHDWVTWREMLPKYVEEILG